MRITHVLNGNIDNILVYCNESVNLKVRQFIYKSEMHYKTLNMVYDGVGNLWTPITVSDYDDKAEFYVIIDRYFDGLNNWDGENTMIVPSYNFEIYEIEKEVSRSNHEKITEWSEKSERWYLDWIKERSKLTSLKEFNYTHNEN